MSSRNHGKASDLAKMEQRLARSGAKRQKRADALAEWQRKLDKGAARRSLPATERPS